MHDFNDSYLLSMILDLLGMISCLKFLVQHFKNLGCHIAGLARPTSLIGGSDRSKQSSSTTRDFSQIQICKRISYGISPPHPINIKGHDRFRASNRSKNTIIHYFSLSLLLCLNLDFPTIFCCSSFVSAMSEGVLGGLPI